MASPGCLRPYRVMLMLHWQNGIAAVLKTAGSFTGEKVRLLHAALMP